LELAVEKPESNNLLLMVEQVVGEEKREACESDKAITHIELGTESRGES
jgi:hypothetical protein